jgi:hypothetical protein
MLSINPFIIYATLPEEKIAYFGTLINPYIIYARESRKKR